MRPPNTPEEGVAFLQALSPSTIRLGLDRVRDALSRLGNPERSFRAIQVAGTNGKGSTCAFADSCLRAAGRRVGLYTSPHLSRVNERIRVGGEDISDEELGRGVLEVIARCPEVLEEPPGLTYFEVGTLVALWHFARQKVEVAVLETGLGGRLDATTAARADVTAISSISFDHVQYLGDTLAKIAFEKAGILRRGVPAVMARQDPEAAEVVERAAGELGSPLYAEGRDFALEREPAGALRYRGLGIRLGGLSLGLRGQHQLENAAVALASLELLARAGVPAGEAAIREGLSKARWPGRLEELPGSPPVLLDGAHNPGGAQILARGLEALYPGRRVHAVFGVLADKDHREIRRLLLPRFATAHLCPVPSPRTLKPAEYLEEARALCPAAIPYARWEDALEGALRAASGPDLVLCTGSLFLVGAAREKLLAQRGLRR